VRGGAFCQASVAAATLLVCGTKLVLRGAKLIPRAWRARVLVLCAYPVCGSSGVPGCAGVESDG